MALSAFFDAARKAAAAVQEGGPRHWFIDCDTDCDGLGAAAVVVASLRRLGHRFSVRASRDKTEGHYRRVLDESAGGWMFLDKGTSHLALFAAQASPERPIFVLDHHNPPTPLPEAPGLHVVNPRLVGLDGGRDASSSTTAALWAICLFGDRALDLAPVAVCGAIGDWQHTGPTGDDDSWQGWNLRLIDDARSSGNVTDEPVPRLIGVDLGEALARGPVASLHAPEAARAFLEAIGIDPSADAEGLDRDARQRLTTAVVLRHLADGGAAAAMTGFVRRDLWHPGLDVGLRQAFRIADACGRSGHGATGIAFLLGDPDAREEALAYFGDYKAALVQAVERLRKEGTKRHRSCQVVWTDQPAYTGMVGGLGMTVVLDDTSVPLVVLAKRPDGEVQASTRGTHAQVQAGMDLGQAVGSAAKRVGREGGGHTIAAGAVIPADGVDAFLDALDEALSSQPWRAGGHNA